MKTFLTCPAANVGNLCGERPPTVDRFVDFPLQIQAVLESMVAQQAGPHQVFEFEIKVKNFQQLAGENNGLIRSVWEMVG